MIVEPQVLDHLATVLEESGLGRELGLRLRGDGDGFSLVPDEPRDDDTVFRRRSRAVLLVDPEVSASLGDRRIEMLDDNGGLRLVRQGR